jgi:hypothetical protein
VKPAHSGLIGRHFSGFVSLFGTFIFYHVNVSANFHINNVRGRRVRPWRLRSPGDVVISTGCATSAGARTNDILSSLYGISVVFTRCK